MPKFRKTLLSVAALAIVILAIQVLVAGDLIAQIRAALVRDADHPARQGITLRHFTTSNVQGIPLYTVPAGKILTIEHMNCTGLGDFFAGIYAGDPNNFANVVLSPPLFGAGFDIRVADTDAKAYLPAGTVLYLKILTFTSTTCMVSGHTVDANP